MADDLRCSADYMPTVIAQLSILASVKAVAPEDRSVCKLLQNFTFYFIVYAC